MWTRFAKLGCAFQEGLFVLLYFLTSLRYFNNLFMFNATRNRENLKLCVTSQVDLTFQVIFLQDTLPSLKPITRSFSELTQNQVSQISSHFFGEFTRCFHVQLTYEQCRPFPFSFLCRCWWNAVLLFGLNYKVYVLYHQETLTNFLQPVL